MASSDEHPMTAPGSDTFSVAAQIADGLRSFMEADYHLRHDAVIAEKRLFLKEPGNVAKEPYIEATPSYLGTRRLGELAIPDALRGLLITLAAQRQSGIYDPPYEHQAAAFERFCAGDDLIVATGTGSGKTEVFLTSIIAELVAERARARTTALHGLRAILLYPMNALVNDQLARIRRLFGDPTLARAIAFSPERLIRFAAYTSRTPYAGTRTNDKDDRRIAPLFDDFFLPIHRGHPTIEQLLVEKGRWPAKDLDAFYGAAPISGNGKNRWAGRLQTAPSDRELLTRNEVLHAIPDILITNYSMLEYMLMRPIERPIFEATADWLAADPKNELVVVLDEAHLYRGAAGAEVALLIRRLLARINADRRRVRFVLTSASFDRDATAVQFAKDLTGLDPEHGRQFAVVRSVLDTPAGARRATVSESSALAAFDLTDFQSGESERARAAIAVLAGRLGWRAPEGDLARYIGQQLAAFGPAAQLVTLVSGETKRLGELPALISEDSATSQAATATLLALASHGCHPDGRSVLPARVHLFFRGLPGLYACTDPRCTSRRAPFAEAPIGRLYLTPQQRCTCNSSARVYELLSHRDCGATFLLGYVDHNVDFVWDEPGLVIDQALGELRALEMLVDGTPHKDAKNWAEAWLDVRSGRIVCGPLLMGSDDSWRRVWIPREPGGTKDELRFRRCPVCMRTWRTDRSKIEPHSTLGEAPFAVLLSNQLASQLPVPWRADQLAEKDRYPNEGRKVLVFSDGRQKAAKLAREIPRITESDVFRAALCVAADRLRELGRGDIPLNDILYVAFISVVADHRLSFFGGEGAQTIAAEVRNFRKRMKGRLDVAIDERLGSPPAAYHEELLRQLCGRFHTFEDLTIGWVAPRRRTLDDLFPALEQLGVPADWVEPLAVAWISDALEEYAFGTELKDAQRAAVAGFPRGNWSFDGARQFRRDLLRKLTAHLEWSESQRDAFTTLLDEHLMREGTNGKYVDPSATRLHVDLDHAWFRCEACSSLEPLALGDRCLNCFEPRAVAIAPDSAYITGRKGFWRTPVVRAVRDHAPLLTLTAAEHTAQLSHRDYSSVHSTTEEHELRFQDILVAESDTPIDILSCTTTMEVGIDIGSLVAVGMRNIPPERSNYQQRAGRAGRRSSGISTVLVYADRGPHDAYYFQHPETIIRGAPRHPEIKIGNRRIVARHIHAHLLQSFFAERAKQDDFDEDERATLQASLGSTQRFFRDPDYGANLERFAAWLAKQQEGQQHAIERFTQWIPSSALRTGESRGAFAAEAIASLMATLRKLGERVPTLPSSESSLADGENTDPDTDLAPAWRVKSALIEFLGDNNVLPTYALPKNLAAFLVDRSMPRGGYQFVKTVERPQTSIAIACSEYAPGRDVVINGQTYRSGGVTADTRFDQPNRAKSLFDKLTRIVACDECRFIDVVEPNTTVRGGHPCPICQAPVREHDMITPEVFMPVPEDAVVQPDRYPEATYVSGAELPLPAGESGDWDAVATHIVKRYEVEQKLISVNKGLNKGRHLPDGEGFGVCTRCGAAGLKDPSRTHTRPYAVAGVRANDKRTCNGTIRRVFLGHQFQTDVLLLRLELRAPMLTRAHRKSHTPILTGALLTIAQALQLAASRSDHLDVDPQELGAGYRLLPPEANRRRMDVFLYDTLAGGAGYAEIAGNHIDQILAETLRLLEDCPAHCRRSCPSCLRHFRNQHLQDRLDRQLAAQLLRYAMTGKAPSIPQADEQLRQLSQLERLMELAGFRMMPATSSSACRFARDGRSIDVVVYPAMLDSDLAEEAIERRFGHPVYAVSDYVLDRDTPTIHREIAQRIAR